MLKVHKECKGVLLAVNQNKGWKNGAQFLGDKGSGQWGKRHCDDPEWQII